MSTACKNVQQKLLDLYKTIHNDYQLAVSGKIEASKNNEEYPASSCATIIQSWISRLIDLALYLAEAHPLVTRQEVTSPPSVFPLGSQSM